MAEEEEKMDLPGQVKDGEDDYDLFGWSVAINNDGTIIAIGAIATREPNQAGTALLNSAWNVSVYVRDPTRTLGWKQLGENIIGRTKGENTGISIALNQDGTRIVIGSDPDGGVGNVRVWDYRKVSYERNFHRRLYFNGRRARRYGFIRYSS